MRQLISTILIISLASSALTMTSKKKAYLRAEAEAEVEVEGQDTTNLQKYCEGVFKGFAKQNNIWKDVAPCVQPSDSLNDYLTTGYSKIGTDNGTAIKEGLYNLAVVAQAVAQAVVQCQVEWDQYEDFVDAIQSMQAPTSLYYTSMSSLLLNGQEIYHELDKANDDIKNQRGWTICGKNIGKALFKVHYGKKTPLDIDYEGFLNKKGKWEARINPRFQGRSLTDLKDSYLGTVIEEGTPDSIIALEMTTDQTIPTSFDSRTKWPGCVHPILDQGDCGSCWAFATTEVLSDKLCIASNGAINVTLSPQYLVGCDTTSLGCSGGYPNRAFQTMANVGVPKESCVPYGSYSGTSPACGGDAFCSDGITSQKRYFAKNGTVTKMITATAIQTHMLTYGPVHASMNVYEDFMYYTGGIYSYVSGALLGGHAVKIVGWGKDATTGVSYWIVANSWSSSWGESGYFRIAFGQCNIDKSSYYALADLVRSPTS